MTGIGRPPTLVQPTRPAGTDMSSLAQRTLPLPHISASQAEARRYSLARRNLLPRGDRVTAVSGLWQHEFLIRSDANIETFLWCPRSVVDHGAAPADPSVTDRVQACVASAVGLAAASFLISERTLRRLHPDLSPPAMLSVVRLPTWNDSALLSSTTGLLLVADGIQYAGNLGTLIRTVDACGADGLLLTNPVARLTNPKVFVASRGTVLSTPVREYQSVEEALGALRAAGFVVYVADPAAVDPYREIPYGSTRLAFVVGSEGDGVSPGWQHARLNRVAIPMLGRADSLNVAASAAILLYEARSRRGTAPFP